MATERVAQTVEVEGLRATLRAFNKYPKDANAELRKASKEIADATAKTARGRAKAMGGVWAIAADSLLGKSDRVPRIVAGGSKRVGSHKVPAGSIFFGAEFGGQGRPTTQQFPPHLGTHGYFLWPTIRSRKSADLQKWLHAMDVVGAKWGEGR